MRILKIKKMKQKPETAELKAKYLIEHELYPYFVNGCEFDEYGCKQVAKLLINSMIKELEAHISHKGFTTWEKERINHWKKVLIEIINYEC